MPTNSPTPNKPNQLSVIEKGRRANWWKRIGTKSRGFKFKDSTGKVITDKAKLERISSLVIPPAWKHVRVSPHVKGKLQAIGVDTTGRIQYLYHPEFTKKQERKKFEKIERFGQKLPKLKAQIKKDLAEKGLGANKVLAVMMQLITCLYFRVGTDKSAKTYKTYGITTLKKNHLKIEKNGKLCFDFTGKSHVKHKKTLVDKDLAKVMAEIKNLGKRGKLFNYLDEDQKPRHIRPADINNYIKSVLGNDFSSKDLRTWGANVIFANRLAKFGTAANESECNKNIVKAIRYTADELGNTPTVCRASYIHPAIIKAYEAGVTLNSASSSKDNKRTKNNEEAALLKLFSFKKTAN